VRSPTQHKFRHYRSDPDGRGDVLIWAQSGTKTMYEADGQHDQIFRGSKQELEVINSALWTANALADEGEADILDVYFDVAVLKTNFYLGLSQSTPVEASTLASITEKAVTLGYARKVLARGTAWTAPTAATGTTSDTVTYTSSGTWPSPVTDCFLTDVSSGTAGVFIAWAVLSAPRSLLNLDTLDNDITVSLE
jgi:hypothetical protein